MSTLIENLRHRRIGRRAREVEAPPVHGARSGRLVAPTTDIAPNDPLVAYFLSSPGAVEVDKLQLDSPALKALRAAGVQMCVPLISQGEMVGLLNLGPRLSGQDYSTDDRGLLNDLSSQAAPAPASCPIGAAAAGRSPRARAYRSGTARGPADTADTPT